MGDQRGPCADRGGPAALWVSERGCFGAIPLLGLGVESFDLVDALSRWRRRFEFGWGVAKRLVRAPSELGR